MLHAENRPHRQSLGTGVTQPRHNSRRNRCIEPGPFQPGHRPSVLRKTRFCSLSRGALRHWRLSFLVREVLMNPPRELQATTSLQMLGLHLTSQEHLSPAALLTRVQSRPLWGAFHTTHGRTDTSHCHTQRNRARLLCRPVPRRIPPESEPYTHVTDNSPPLFCATGQTRFCFLCVIFLHRRSLPSYGGVLRTSSCSGSATCNEKQFLS